MSVNTVAQIMAEQGLRARPKRRRYQTTRPGRGRWRAPDLVARDFAAATINHKWYGDGTEIGTEEGKLFLEACWMWRPAGSSGSRCRPITTLTAPTALWPWRSLSAAAPKRSPGSFCIPIRAASTPRTGSGPLVSGWRFGSRWAGLGRRWTMRSSNPGIPPWSSSCAPSNTSPPGPRPAPRSRLGSITTTATDATRRCR